MVSWHNLYRHYLALDNLPKPPFIGYSLNFLQVLAQYI